MVLFFFKITSESSIAAGVRRIEAITAEKAEEFVAKQSDLMKEINEILKNPKNVTKSIQDLLNEKNTLTKEVERLQNKELQSLKQNLIEKVEEKDGVSTLYAKVELPDAKQLKQLAFDLKNKVDNLFLVLAADIAGKPQVAVMIAENLVSEKDLHAGKIVKELAKEIKGGGGGQPFFATAGGKDVSGLDQVIEKAKTII